MRSPTCPSLLSAPSAIVQPSGTVCILYPRHASSDLPSNRWRQGAAANAECGVRNAEWSAECGMRNAESNAEWNAEWNAESNAESNAEWGMRAESEWGMRAESAGKSGAVKPQSRPARQQVVKVRRIDRRLCDGRPFAVRAF